MECRLSIGREGERGEWVGLREETKSVMYIDVGGGLLEWWWVVAGH